MYYTYLHRRESDNKPFYIGKGLGKRAWAHRGRNDYWARTVAKHGLKVEIVAEWKTEEEAFEHEKFLISCFRDMGHELVNLTDGGDGASGYKHGEERLRWLKDNNPARRPEVREKIAKNRSGIRVSPETKERISGGVSRLWADPEYKRMQSDAHKGSKMPDSQKTKISAALNGIKRSQETIAKMKLAATLREQRKRESRGDAQ